MSAGYDPFRWADNFESEEEYMKELEEENAKKRISENGRKNTSNADSSRK